MGPLPEPRWHCGAGGDVARDTKVRRLTSVVIAAESTILLVIGLRLVVLIITASGAAVAWFGFAAITHGVVAAGAGLLGCRLAYMTWRGSTWPLLVWGGGAVLAGILMLQGYLNRPEPYVTGYDYVGGESVCNVFENVDGKPVCTAYGTSGGTPVPVYERSEGNLVWTVAAFSTAAACFGAFAWDRKEARPPIAIS